MANSGEGQTDVNEASNAKVLASYLHNQEQKK